MDEELGHARDMWRRLSIVPLFFLFSGCSSVPWNSVEGLKDGVDFQRLPLLAAALPEPEVFSALEGDSTAITENEAGLDLRRGRVLLEIRKAGCSACERMEKTLADIKPETFAGGRRWVRLEIQGDSSTMKYRSAVVPTLVVLESGVEIGRLLGNREGKVVREFLDHPAGKR